MPFNYYLYIHAAFIIKLQSKEMLFLFLLQLFIFVCRNIFTLPHSSSMRNWISNIDAEPGFQLNVLQALNKLKEEEKIIRWYLIVWHLNTPFNGMSIITAAVNLVNMTITHQLEKKGRNSRSCSILVVLLVFLKGI